MEVERCLPSDETLLLETKKYFAYQELYSWQEHMGLYDCDVDYLKVYVFIYTLFSVESSTVHVSNVS